MVIEVARKQSAQMKSQQENIVLVTCCP